VFLEKLLSGSKVKAKNVQILVRVVERAFSNFKRQLLGAYGADCDLISHRWSWARPLTTFEACEATPFPKMAAPVVKNDHF
jgi:hypothetical protein